MTVRLEVSVEIAAPPSAVWDILVDWSGQGRWIPFTTVATTTDHDEGLGVRAEALSGFWLGPMPVGLLDRFVVTGWTPPGAGRAELEVLHLGPYFTGVGVFALDPAPGGTTVTATEMINVAGGTLDPVIQLALPVMGAGFAHSLRSLGALATHRS